MPASAFAASATPVALASAGCCARLLPAVAVDVAVAGESCLSDVAALPGVGLAATGAVAAANTPSVVAVVVAVPLGVFCWVRDAAATAFAAA
jgi:hypothetical protein